MKVIFLDIDGVLNSTDYMNALHINYREAVNRGITQYPITDQSYVRDKYGHLFDPRCVLFLEAIINKTQAKIVISSTWRLSGLQEMINMWQYRNLPGEVVGITPHYYTKRGDEIQQYIDTHPEITNYVIIDDDSDMLPSQTNNFVKTSNQFGIDVHTYKSVVNILENHTIAETP